MKAIVLSLVMAIFGVNTAFSQDIVPVRFFKKAIDEGQSVQILDVRSDAEFGKSHLENAKHINVMEEGFVERSLEFLDKTRPVYVYCKSGGRSNLAAGKLQKAGFKTVDMKGGITAWELAGYPIVEGVY